MTNNEVLEVFRSTNALLEGHFLLSSGLHSDKYFQCALALKNPANAEKLVSALIKKLEFDVNEIDMIVGPAHGGVIVGYELARQLKKDFIFAERVDNEMSIRRGFEIKKGDKIVICEDVITTGKSILEVKKIIEEKGGIVVAFASLINRAPEGTDFGVPYNFLAKVDAKTYKPEACELCKDSEPYKPGSRKM